ncbi:MAG TPA: hypothetical protein VF992_01885 [Thermoplasmata archaeon]
MAARRGRSLVGMAVVDSEGVEVGYVSVEEPNALLLGEGSSGRMRLGRRFVAEILDRVTLKGPAAEIFTGLNVVDSEGEFVGVVKDTMEAEDVLDSFIVEDEQGEMVTVLLEDVRSIDEWVELSVSGESLYDGG